MRYSSRNHTIDDITKISPLKSIKHRLPWLVLGLVGGFIAAKIISVFEDTLQKNLTLALFIPLIVYMSDAVGTQMEAFAIRDISLHSRLNFWKYFLKQLITVVLIALILAIATFLITYPLYFSYSLSLVVSLSLFAAIVSSIFTGLLIPYFFSKKNLDPANASGPIATVIQDLFSVSIYFLLAHFLLS